jgi:hypothetical protein
MSDAHIYMRESILLSEMRVLRESYRTRSRVISYEKAALNGALRALAYYLLLILILRLTGIAPDGNV